MQTRGLSVDLTALGLIRGSSSKSVPATTTAPASPPDLHPNKRIKRSYTLDSSASRQPVSLPARPRVRKTSASERRDVKDTKAAPFSTPPPSPKHPDDTNAKRIDKQGINDDIVVAVLEQLEATGNRPHLIKELVAVLVNILPVVESSQNPIAIISSRLTNYLKRPWTALAPCPLTKEQATVHPRRVYYFLTTIPRQEIPEYAPNYDPKLPNRHIISPSISSGPDEDLDIYEFSRAASSPTPELDFNLELIDEIPSDLASHNIAEIHFDSADFNLNLDEHEAEPNHASPSLAPPTESLEHDEREFSRTAGAMRQRQASDLAESRSLSPADMDLTTTNGNGSKTIFPVLNEEPDEMSEHDREELNYLRDHEASIALFGQSQHHHMLHDFASSPMLKPVTLKDKENATPRKNHQSPFLSNAAFGSAGWGELKSPEDMDLSELDNLLGDHCSG